MRDAKGPGDWRCVFCGVRVTQGALACLPHLDLLRLDPHYDIPPLPRNRVRVAVK